MAVHIKHGFQLSSFTNGIEIKSSVVNHRYMSASFLETHDNDEIYRTDVEKMSR